MAICSCCGAPVQLDMDCTPMHVEPAQSSRERALVEAARNLLKVASMGILTATAVAKVNNALEPYRGGV